MTIFTMACYLGLDALRCLSRDDDGAAAIEYGLIIAGIALALVGAVFAGGNDLSSLFNVVGSAISSGNDQAN